MQFNNAVDDSSDSAVGRSNADVSNPDVVIADLLRLTIAKAFEKLRELGTVTSERSARILALRSSRSAL
jgi:hypothetical protein